MPRATLFLILAIGITAAPLGSSADDPFTPEEAAHWAWRPPRRPPPPEVQNPLWCLNEIDRFVLARMEQDRLTPAVEASREQLIRRATFDLTGLPPAPEEIQAFLEDHSPGAWERVIDRLLASPHYGERWGRHWLDLVRYAESNGYEHDELRPDAWRYRDYVIASFNADKPYDRFILEQLAGDELFPGDGASLVATGFNLLGPDMTDSADMSQRRQNTLNDMTDTAALVFLGLTLGCARCHDHKFEPLPQRDYYRFQAFFTPVVFRQDLPLASAAQLKAYEAALGEYQALIRPYLDEIKGIEEPKRQRLYEARFAKLSEEAQTAHKTPAAKRTLSQAELVEKSKRQLGVSAAEVARALTAEEQARVKNLHQQIQQLSSRKPQPLPAAMGIVDAGPIPPKTYLLDRGDLVGKTEEVHPGFPIILDQHHQATPAAVIPYPASTGRRTTLARWIARPDHPLTARVIVNRLWQHHFGRGIVATASDFGLRGERPTHPELLDWLACELVNESSWSLKRIHRLMLLSATYRQSSKATPQALLQDPDNLLFSRMNRKRLEAEVVRDSLLAVSGGINHAMGGPSVLPPIPAEALQGTNAWKASPRLADQQRRSVYVLARRNLRFPLLEAFDLPDSNLSCSRRERSTTAPQALALLNSSEASQAARAFSSRLESLEAAPPSQVALAFRLALGRQPTAAEQGRCQEFLEHSPLAELCRAIFNLNEFLYLD